MVAHLEAEVCPPGARVWPVQSVGWLSSCIDLGLHGYVTITSCKTDYVVLTTAAWDSLTHQSTTGSTIGGQQLLEVLPLTLAFYEVGEVRGLRILVRSSPVQSVSAFWPPTAHPRQPTPLVCLKAKTTKALKADPGKAVRQGVLELLAGDALRSCPGKSQQQAHNYKGPVLLCMCAPLSSDHAPQGKAPTLCWARLPTRLAPSIRVLLLDPVHCI